MPVWTKGVVPVPSYDVLAHMLHKIKQESIDHAHVYRLLALIQTHGLADHHQLGNDFVISLIGLRNSKECPQPRQNMVFRGDYHPNPIIPGYAQCGIAQDAVSLSCGSDQDARSIHITNKHTLKALLKTCRDLKDSQRGLEIHAEIARMDYLEGDVSMGNMLVDMYIKCGLLALAHEIFYKLPARDVVSWNALITGLTENGLSEEALKLYDEMDTENVLPDAVTFVSCLKACGCIKAMGAGCAIHAEAERKGLLRENPVLGTALVAMYVRCGFLERAQEAFDRLAIRDTIVWTTLIVGYAELGQGAKALHSFESMQLQGVVPDSITYVCSLKACGSIQALSTGQKMHIDIQKKGILQKNLDIGNALVDMYCKCGLLGTSQQVFDRLPAKDVVSWNTLITGYSEQGKGKEAIKCFENMQLAGVCPSTITFICILQACGSIKAAEKGRELHMHVIKNGLLELDIVVGSVLVNMYGRCDMLAEAQNVFNELPAQNVVTWNALIAGYVEHGHDGKALGCLLKMQLDGVDPNIVTYVWGLQACGRLGAIQRGESIHAEIKGKGNLEGDLVINTALVDMYAKCGCLFKAQQLFDKLPIRNVVSWTALVAGYADHGHGQEALNCFDQMQLEGVTPNAITLLSILKACASIGGVEEGREVVDNIARHGLIAGDMFVGNAMVDAYSKCGSFAKAQEVFDRLPVRDVISWNVLIAGYIEHDQNEDALECLKCMQLEGVSPDPVTYLWSLKACAKTGATDSGQEFHVEIERKGLLDRDVTIGSTLVDMYAKCGLLTKAQEVLDKLPCRNAVSWNALISGFAELGEGKDVFHTMNRMLRDGFKPDCVTFLIVLSACNLTGLFDTSQSFFEVMTRNYGVVPILEHYGCMVDLLGRAGEVDKAKAMVQKMPAYPNSVIWHILLGSCKKWGNAKLGKQAFESAVCLNEKDGAAYALMHDIYAGADK